LTWIISLADMFFRITKVQPEIKPVKPLLMLVQ